jgi:hypothetical protein
MRKLILTCECGQRMQVPRSAIGRKGICPGCGRTVSITGDNTSAVPNSKGGGGILGGAGQFWGKMTGRQGGGPEPSEDAKRRFGEAVDLYHQQRYAEALAIFNSLAKQFPDNPNIETGRQQCLNALKRPASLPISGSVRLLEGSKLDEDTVKRVVLEKLLSGATDSVQLQAADIAARILGLSGGPKTPPHEGNGASATQDEVDAAPAEEKTATEIRVETRSAADKSGDESTVPRGLYDLGAAAPRE